MRYILILFFLCSFLVSRAQYDIKVEVEGLSCDSTMVLAFHYGDKKLISDSSTCQKGIYHFTGEENLQSGVYLILLNASKWFEILVSDKEDQTKYYFKTDTSFSQASRQVKGSKENELFLDFGKFATKEGEITEKIRQAYLAEDDEDKKEALRDELIAALKVVTDRRDQIAKENPKTFVASLHNSMKEVVAPTPPEELTKAGKIDFNYKWMLEHYWDNIDMSEDGLIRSPIFSQKLKRYFDYYIPPLPDTAILMAENLIRKIETGGSTLQYKYTVQFITKYFEDAKYTCFDKAVWHMVNTYYCSGKAYWADSAHIEKLCKELGNGVVSHCDKTAADMSMPDTSFQKRIDMYSIDKPVTVLVFWDINCGHCKKEMPILSNMYDSMGNEHFEIYAVYTKGEFESWKKRVAKEKYKFINVTNAFGDDKFHKNYNIVTVPQIFVLDKDKKIKFKKIGAKDVPGIINYLLEEQGIIEKEE